MINIEEECWKCEGSGRMSVRIEHSKYSNEMGCNVCDGHGKILTVEGREFIKALKYYLSK